MRTVLLPARELRAGNPAVSVGRLLSRLDPESVVRIKVTGKIGERALAGLSLSEIRRLAPPTMNVSIAIEGPRF